MAGFGLSEPDARSRRSLRSGFVASPPAARAQRTPRRSRITYVKLREHYERYVYQALGLRPDSAQYNPGVAARIGVGVAVVAALVALPGCSRQAPPEAPPAPIAVKVRAARAQTLKDVLSAPGTVVPAPAADLVVIAPEACQVAELPQPEGAVVKAGDVLVRYDIG